MKIRFGMGAVRASRLAALCGGEWIAEGDLDPVVNGLATHSGEVDAETAFVALRGKRTDGLCFLPAARAAGCPCVLCEGTAGPPAIRVENAGAALRRLAANWREQLAFRAVGITGSAGKTTAKELVANALSCEKRTFRTSGNHNSTLGMPLSLLEAAPGTEWAVLEMGMNAPGEIRELSRLARPEIAVITNVGTAHVGAFGSREAIFAAKSEILEFLEPGGLFLQNADDDLLSRLHGKNFRTLSLSAKGRKADFSANNIRVGPESTVFDLAWDGKTERDLSIPLAGAHFVSDALFAFAVGVVTGLSPDRVREGLRIRPHLPLRQARTVIAGVTLIEDCYNASPESMIAALDLLDALTEKAGRAVAVLGDMRELGAMRTALHRRVGERVAESRIALLFTLGNGGSEIAAGARGSGKFAGRICENRDFSDPETLAGTVGRDLRRGDVVLIKASRAVGAERLGSALKSFLWKKAGVDRV